MTGDNGDEQSMYGINYQRSVYMLVVLICSRIE